MLTKEEKTEIKSKWQKHPKDGGSVALRVALATKEIKKLTEHFKSNKHDNNSKRGLFLKIAQRKKMLNYLSREDKEAYARIMKELEL